MTDDCWWVVIDEQGLPDFITVTEDMAHDHIKGLQEEFLDEPEALANISKYIVRPVVAPAQPLSDARLYAIFRSCFPRTKFSPSYVEYGRAVEHVFLKP